MPYRIIKAIEKENTEPKDESVPDLDDEQPNAIKDTTQELFNFHNINSSRTHLKKERSFQRG